MKTKKQFENEVREEMEHMVAGLQAGERPETYVYPELEEPKEDVSLHSRQRFRTEMQSFISA